MKHKPRKVRKGTWKQLKRMKKSCMVASEYSNENGEECLVGVLKIPIKVLKNER